MEDDLILVALDDELDVDVARREALLDDASALLNSQWPRSGGWREAVGKSCSGLPLHLVGLLNDSVVVHASLHPCTIQGDSRNVILQSLVVKDALRGHGIGRRFLRKVEERTATRGAGYIYLSTTDQQEFYRRCGYMECEPVNLDLPVLRGEERRSALSGLEGLLRRRLDGTAAVAPSLPHTWFQKRLRAFPKTDEAKPFFWSSKKHEEFLLQASSSSPHAAVEGFCSDALLLKQIGPSCGLTALVMILDTLSFADGSCLRRSFTITSEEGGKVEWGDSSPLAAKTGLTTWEQRRGLLFEEAIARRITTDGEVFSTLGLAEAARDICGAEVTVKTDLNEVEDLMSALRACLLGSASSSPSSCFILLAFDADNTNGYHPCFHGGSSAHWGVVVGALIHGERSSDSSSSGGGDDMTVLLLHSASSLPIACSLRELVKSNLQLKSADARRARLSNWVLPRPRPSSVHSSAAAAPAHDTDDGSSFPLDLAGGFVAIRA